MPADELDRIARTIQPLLWSDERQMYVDAAETAARIVPSSHPTCAGWPSTDSCSPQMRLGRHCGLFCTGTGSNPERRAPELHLPFHCLPGTGTCYAA